MPQEPIRWGGPGPVEVRLTNAGDRPLVVNARLAPGYRDSSSRELFAEIFKPSSDEIAAAETLYYDRHPPQREDYIELAPGQTLTDSFDLLDWYRLPGPGAYEVVVYYQADEPLAVEIPGLLQGTHASDRVPFTVEAEDS